jgi:alpha-ketoglutarate-dependent taurine dioxygenase
VVTVSHREVQLAKDEGGAVAVDTVADLVRAAARHPDELVVLRGGQPVTPAELGRYCRLLGGVLRYEAAGEIRTVRNDPSIPDSTAMSDRALPMHTDGSFMAVPPEHFMLSVVRDDGGSGGVSLFMPVSEVLAAAPDRVVEALMTADYLFPRTYDGDLTDSYVGPVLTRRDPSLRIRWRSDDLWRPRVVESRGTDAGGAVDWLHEFLGTAEPYGYVAEVGDTLLVPNTVLLHGRTALSAGSPRELLRAWVMTDGAQPPVGDRRTERRG